MIDRKDKDKGAPNRDVPTDWEAPRVTLLKAGSAESNANITPDGAGSGFS